MKITKKQIVALDKQETTVRELFPEVFKTELEEGKWYIDKEYPKKGLIYITKYNNINEPVCAYGFSFVKGEYTQEHCRWVESKEAKETLRLATKEEVETALINETKRKYENYKNVKKIKCLHDFDKEAFQEYYNKDWKFYYEEEYNKLWIRNTSYLDICVFSDGNWAEIIQPKQMTKEEIEKELGYEIEIKL